MLRSSFTQSRQLLLSPARSRTAAQWLPKAGASNLFAGQRFFADAKPPVTGAPTPASPSSESPIPPETVPKPSPGSTPVVHRSHYWFQGLISAAAEAPLQPSRKARSCSEL
ncbi:hypothetical protein CNMCM5878_005208 [Aspergillus fumigatiaffinis]|nr:hypothetical protein CNMCM5878_005208 [Aspergillus fumigatiaffinis]